MTAMLVLGTLAVPRASAQDNPPKVEAPKPAPPAAPDQPQDPIPPPPDVQQKEATPTEKQKAAPPALDDPQPATAPAPGAGAQESALDAVEALSSKYKFSERYSIADADDRAHPELITQYRVGVRETTKGMNEKAQGAPERFQRVRECIYTERAAKVGRHDEAIALMRRYDNVSLKDGVPGPPLNPPLLKGLTIWYQRRPPMRPLVLSLTPNRRLREYEYGFIAWGVGIPQLLAFFPRVPVRVTGTWSIMPKDISQLLGEDPDPEDFKMTGTLLRVSKAEDGKGWTAEIGISGEFNAPFAGLSSFEAQIDFSFEPRGVALPARGSEAIPKAEGVRSGSQSVRRDAVVEATGRITKALLSHAAARPIPGGDGRLKRTITTELVLERRWGEHAGQTTPLDLPATAPTETEDNSWVVYDDPERKFQFRHPQELRPQGEYTMPGLLVELVHEQTGGGAFIVCQLPKEGEHYFEDPTGFGKWVDADFERKKVKVTRGTSGYLADEEWKPLNRRVYRLEAGIKPFGEQERDIEPHYVDFYLVTFGGNHNYMFQAWNKGADHVAYRRQAEEIIKSFQVVSLNRPNRAPVAAPSTTPAVTPSPSTPPPVTGGATTGTRGATPEPRDAAPGSPPAGPAAPNSRPQ